MPDTLTSENPQVLPAATSSASLAEAMEILETISRQCRRSEPDANTLNTWKQCYQDDGLEALKSVAYQGSAVETTVEQAITSLALAHPDWGIARYRRALKNDGIDVGDRIVRDTLFRLGLATEEDRLTQLQDEALNGRTERCRPHMARIERANPAFADRDLAVTRAGELVVQGTAFIGSVADLGRIYLQAAVDCYGGYAFGRIHGDRRAACAISLLHQRVLPFFAQQNIKVAAISTQNGGIYGRRSADPYPLYLLLNDIDHRPASDGSPAGSGFLKRFIKQAKTGFFQPRLGGDGVDSLDALQAAFDHWLQDYNHAEASMGFPNFGRTPWETTRDGRRPAEPLAEYTGREKDAAARPLRVKPTALSPRAPFEKRSHQDEGRQSRYLARHDRLEDAGIPGITRSVIGVVGLIVALFLAWAALTPFGEVTAAPGEVIPAGEVQVLQHLEGGIIAEILVDDGELVEAGQTLIRLDPAGSRARLESMRAERAGLILKAERLRAFAEGRPGNFALVGTGYPDLESDQRAILTVQERAHAERRAVLEWQIEKHEAQVDLLLDQQETHGRIIALAEEELAMRQHLLEKGLQSKIKVLDVERQAATASGGLVKLQGEIDVAEQALAESQSRLVELDATMREDALEQLDVVVRDLAQLSKAIAEQEDRVNRLAIRAPVSGLVKGLQVHTVGGVIPAGAMVMEIVPMDKELFVEARISARDVGYVRAGQPVNVKVMTYDFARYGGIPGTLSAVSASSFVDPEGIPFYEGIIKLDRPYVGDDASRNRILPGMTVEADITTGEKTLLQYLLKPVYASIDKGFHER